MAREMVKRCKQSPIGGDGPEDGIWDFVETLHRKVIELVSLSVSLSKRVVLR